MRHMCAESFWAGRGDCWHVLYAGFTIVTGLYIGYVSLAVGWLVGKAIMLGSKGIGGRRYQIAAVVLTYAAVSLAAVPIAISYYMKAKSESPSIQSKQQQPSPDKQPASPIQAQAEPTQRLSQSGGRALATAPARPCVTFSGAAETHSRNYWIRDSDGRHTYCLEDHGRFTTGRYPGALRHLRCCLSMR